MKKNKLLFAAFFGVLTVILVILCLLGAQYFTRVGCKSTGEHPIANKLNENISVLPYFKDGNIYYYKNGESILAAENVYDTDSETPVFTADYAIDSLSEKMLYTSNGILYLFDGKTREIARSVTSWRASKGMKDIAFTTAWQGDKSLGALFLYTGENIIPLDTGITVSSVRFSQDGGCIFAEKPNTYPKVRSKLFRYSLTGEKELMYDGTYPVFWVNDDGTQVITGENNDDSLYSYRVFSDNFKKTLELSDVYYTEVTDDKSILYALSDYDSDARRGSLWAIDMYSLKKKLISDNVSFFNASGVTDASKGVIYSTLSDETNGYYSIYYGDISGKSTRLIRNTTEESLYTVAINSQRKTGYILTYGATKNDGGVYYVKWKNKSLDVTPVISGYVDSLVYYENTDSVSFIKDPDEKDFASLYFAAGAECAKVLDGCGTTYDAANRLYQSASVFSDNGDSVMYFTDIVTGGTAVDTSGTLNLKTSAATTEIAENVSSSYMEAPVTCGDMSKIFYLRENGTVFDLYLFENNCSTLIASGVHGVIELK